MKSSPFVPAARSTLSALDEPSGVSLGSLMLALSVSSWAGLAHADGALKEVKVVDKAEVVQGKDAIQTKQTTIGKGKQDIRDIPQSITVMTEKLLDDVKLDTLKDALHYTAGITFAATENGTDQDIRMRGFPVATTGDLLIDGMRDPSQYDRDTFNLDRIEVMRGSASMLFGRGSTGGVINQVTKKPLLADQSDVAATVGSRGYLRTTGDFNIRTDEDAALRMNVMMTKANNGGATVDKYGIAPTYSWGIGSRDEFTVGVSHLNVDNVPQAAIRYLNGTVPNISPGNFYGTRSDYLKGEATFAHASWTRRLDDGGELRSQVRSGVFDRSQWGTVAGFGTTNGATTTQSNLSGSTVLTRSGLAARKDRYKTTYVQSDYSNSYDAWGMKHNLLAGVDAAHEEADRFQSNGVVGTNYNKGNTSVGTPNDGRTLSASPTYRPSSNYSAKALGFYAQDLVQFAPSWKFLVGARHDNFSGDFSQLNYATGTNGAYTGTSTTRLSNSVWSYRTGLLYQPAPDQSYHISYGTSFNTSADTYQYVTAQTANTPPEKSRNFEIGAKLDWLEGKLSTRLAVFRTEKFNERTTDADFAGSAYVLSGKRHSAGLEMDVVGRITPKLEVYLSYSWIPVATIDQIGSAQANVVGSRVGLTPTQTGAAWVSYQAMPKLRIAGGLRGASVNRPLQGTSGAASTTARAPGYMVADAMVEYNFTPDVYGQINVSNITNKLYGDQLYPGFVISGAPRTALMTLGMRF
ncbi:TonB-dependent siderophore receptor [Curvibacter sp. HBC28]|uniref:TonB-dependent siderophore receptor n=1 Tax=Curvibacter microcysteis TaxID=3026419 RepID=A0ABT5MLF9_9BURK|nr:TonB-dependent siderophore receptor [Curvibacter sp. HBC28]MDD0816001.1 TonB-dependent siderophore receptor [Curvibacter sp. HBC28]